MTYVGKLRESINLINYLYDNIDVARKEGNVPYWVIEEILASALIGVDSLRLPIFDDHREGLESLGFIVGEKDTSGLTWISIPKGIGEETNAKN